MKASDQFHVGIVVDDLEAASAELSQVFGHQWCAEMVARVPVRLADGDRVLDLRSKYSTSVPRVEIVQSVPGTVWTPAADSGIHHLGYWSDDVAGDSVDLERQGYAIEAAGVRPDGAPYWAYHRSRTGPRIELVTRTLQPVLERHWTSGEQPS